MPESVFPSLCDCDCACAWAWKGPVPLRSVVGGQLMAGGPIDVVVVVVGVVVVGVMSMGSRGGARVEPDEGRMGMDL